MLKVFSYGGGVQSTAALVLAAQGKIDYKTFLFCNVGDDSENPDTITYVHDVAMPYAQRNGIELIELQRTGTSEQKTLYALLMRENTPSIPVYLGSGAPANRSCTRKFKVAVVDRWLKEHGAKQSGATVGLGISLDEWHRMRTGSDPETPWKQVEYPLIDLRLDRAQCLTIIEHAGLPIPSKSSCYFCPFHTIRRWQEMRHTQPVLFQKACDLEASINERRAKLGKDQVWLTGKLKPLAKVTTEYQQGNLFEDDQAICESGYCMI